MSKDNVIELVQKDDIYEVPAKQSQNNTVIIAPHPDDEIIGVYEVLIKSNPIIIYSGNTEVKRREEALKLKDHTTIKGQMFQMSVPPIFLNKNSIFYFPDPTTELHPIHRQYGMMGEQMARGGMNVIFYTTNMNAPYIHEVQESDKKEDLLNKVYPSQKSLWEYDKKYILFEGFCKWIF